MLIITWCQKWSDLWTLTKFNRSKMGSLEGRKHSASVDHSKKAKSALYSVKCYFYLFLPTWSREFHTPKTARKPHRKMADSDKCHKPSMNSKSWISKRNGRGFVTTASSLSWTVGLQGRSRRGKLPLCGKQPRAPPQWIMKRWKVCMTNMQPM